MSQDTNIPPSGIPNPDSPMDEIESSIHFPTPTGLIESEPSYSLNIVPINDILENFNKLSNREMLKLMIAMISRASQLLETEDLHELSEAVQNIKNEKTPNKPTKKRKTNPVPTANIAT